jgi:hypothetical protein
MSDWISMDEILSATDGAFGANQLLNPSGTVFRINRLMKNFIILLLNACFFFINQVSLAPEL